MSTKRGWLFVVALVGSCFIVQGFYYASFLAEGCYNNGN